MNRRSFLRRVGTGVVGALVVAQVPASVIDRIGLHELSRDRIRDQMRRIYNECAKGGRHPREIHLGREAYDTFKGDLLANERFISYADARSCEESLLFKAAKVRPVGRGWTMRIAA